MFFMIYFEDIPFMWIYVLNFHLWRDIIQTILNKLS